MYKLIVTDVDGTLIDKESNLPSLNKKALFACKDKGIGVVLATGKTIDAIYPLVRDLDLKLPQITLSGAATLNKDLKVISSIKFNPEYYFNLIKDVKRKGYTPITCILDGKIFYEKYHPNMEHIREVGEKLIKVDSIETKYFQKNTANINVPIPETDPLDSYLRSKYSDILQIVRSGKYFFDILNKNATKGNALLNILKLLGIKKQEVVVFGDSYNDLSLFEVCGLKIAVKNSYPEVIDAADIITSENYNAGLGKAIYKYVLKEEI